MYFTRYPGRLETKEPNRDQNFRWCLFFEYVWKNSIRVLWDNWILSLAISLAFRPILVGIRDYSNRLSFIVWIVGIYSHAPTHPPKKLEPYGPARAVVRDSILSVFNNAPGISWVGAQLGWDGSRDLHGLTRWSRPAHPSQQSPWVMGRHGWRVGTGVISANGLGPGGLGPGGLRFEGYP